MNQKQFKKILTGVRDAFLMEMVGQARIPQPPHPWDINNGLCEDFTNEVCQLVPEAEEWVSDFPDEIGHTFIYWHRRYYDAECLDGVTDYLQLPIFLNQNKTREQVVAPKEVGL